LDLNEDGNARRVAAQHGDNIRYCHAFKKWLVWDGRRWKTDDSGQVRQLARETMAAFLAEAAQTYNDTRRDFANDSCKSSAITGMLKMLEGEFAISTADLDLDPHLLNFTNGTVDLRTGTVTAHRREDYITKLVHYAYDPEAECPIFLSFLQRITSHAGLIEYLQRALGYSLTGRTIEKAVFVLYGDGDNGKSTLLSTILQLLDEYAVLLQIDTLMARQESSNAQADLADLRGARFAMTSETEEGQRLAEGKLKRITQGMGRIKATRKYENPVEFPETHKLWIDANHLPKVSGKDKAIWNRLHAIPFDVTIPKAEQDKTLQNKLLDEAEGILAWTVRGAVRWHQEGLGKPPDVEQAVAQWRADSDDIARFLDDCCQPEGQVSAKEFYDQYLLWAKDAGVPPCSNPVFSQRVLLRDGVSKKSEAQGNVYYGVRLNRPGRVGCGRFRIREKPQ
jgi:putative DNA primase/helicase